MTAARSGAVSISCWSRMCAPHGFPLILPAATVYLNIDVSKSESKSIWDQEFRPIDGYTSDYDAQQKMWTQELRIASPANSTYDFVAGVFRWFNGEVPVPVDVALEFIVFFF